MGLKKNYPDMNRPYVAPGGKFGCWFTIVVYIFMLIFADRAALATSGVVTVAAIIYWAVFTRKHENKIPTIEEEIGVLEEPSLEEKAKMDKEYTHLEDRNHYCDDHCTWNLYYSGALLRDK